MWQSLDVIKDMMDLKETISLKEKAVQLYCQRSYTYLN